MKMAEDKNGLTSEMFDLEDGKNGSKGAASPPPANGSASPSPGGPPNTEVKRNPWRTWEDIIVAAFCVLGLLIIGIDVVRSGNSTVNRSKYILSETESADGQAKEKPSQTLTLSWQGEVVPKQAANFNPSGKNVASQNSSDETRTALQWTRTLTVPESTKEGRDWDQKLRDQFKEFPNVPPAATWENSEQPSKNTAEVPVRRVFAYTILVLALFFLATFWESVSAILHKPEDQPQPLSPTRMALAAGSIVTVAVLIWAMFAGTGPESTSHITVVVAFASAGILLLNVIQSCLFGKKPKEEEARKIRSLFDTHLAGKATAAAALIAASAFSLNRAIEPFRDSMVAASSKVASQMRNGRTTPGSNPPGPAPTTPVATNPPPTIQFPDFPTDVRKQLRDMHPVIAVIGNQLSEHHQHQGQTVPDRSAALAANLKKLGSSRDADRAAANSAYDTLLRRATVLRDAYTGAQKLWSEGQISSGQLEEARLSALRAANAVPDIKAELAEIDARYEASISNLKAMEATAISMDDKNWAKNPTVAENPVYRSRYTVNN